MAAVRSVHFFRMPAFYWFLLGISLMGLLTVVALFPNLLPYDKLWHLGTFLRYMAYDQSTLSNVICCAAWVIHLLEASYAYHLCRKLHLTNEDTVKWCMQTFILGFPSLVLLLMKSLKQSN